MMTGILSRRREFAVLQAVGMTNRQLKTMLIYEGLFYAMSSVAAAFYSVAGGWTSCRKNAEQYVLVL